ncbi:MAG: peroxiredoxin [Acidobacteriota bacterium]|nr:peroxiredoxin [Acidobacteriota bacterium]
MTERNHLRMTNSVGQRTTLWGGVMTLALAAVVSLACTSGDASADHHKLAEGSPAPDFTLAADDGRMVKLSEYKGKQPVVLYFYPKDETPGCTKQACSFRDNFKAFKDAGIEVLGVSVDTVDSHKAFKKNQKLNFTLLADDKKEVSKSYGVLSERGYSSRVTFVIDKEGVIRKIYTNVDPVANATETLEFAKTL